MSALTLTQQQVDGIVAAYESGNFSYPTEVLRLISAGYSQQEAEQQVTEVVKQLRQQIFNARKNAGKKADGKKASFYIILMVASIAPVFDVTSVTWLAIAVVIAIAAAYWGNKDRPAGAIAAAIVMVLLFPVTYSVYMKGRTSYIRIEMLLPLLMAAVPAGIAYVLFNAIIPGRKTS